MNTSCEHCKKIRDMGITALCRICWRVLNVNGKKKGK